MSFSFKTWKDKGRKLVYRDVKRFISRLIAIIFEMYNCTVNSWIWLMYILVEKLDEHFSRRTQNWIELNWKQKSTASLYKIQFLRYMANQQQITQIELGLYKKIRKKMCIKLFEATMILTNDLLNHGNCATAQWVV